ncbi:MAG: glycosyltransferase family 39 protein [Acidobacteriia bacterium]|nr:glycosyltransferase family 39 protein [Terriglobia bacterium]
MDSRATDRLTFFLLAVIFGAGWFLVGAGRNTPVIDDWVYSWSVEHFLRTGELRVLEYSGTYPVAQVLWAALFGKLLGFSFATLHLATVTLSAIGCWAWYLTLRELDVDARASLLATLALVFNPVFFALSFSFMTDAPFVSASNVAVYCLVSAARRDRPGRLWIGCAIAVAAFLIRPLGVAIPIAALVALPWRASGRPWRLWQTTAAEWIAPPVCAIAAMAALWIVTTRTMGQADWQTIRMENLRWWTSIPLTQYAGWNVRILCETMFPLAPVLLAALFSRRSAVIASGIIAVAIAIVLSVTLREIPSPLPNWQTWSLQDIGARAMLTGVAATSAWSARVTPWLRGVSLLVIAAAIVGLAGVRNAAPEDRRGAGLLVALAALHLILVNTLWLYNDRYYIVFAPLVAYLATRLGPMRLWIAGPLLALWACVAVTGARDMLGVNDTAGGIARRLEASGVKPWEIDAGYAWNGWRLYAHPENLAPGGDPQSDVPFVTSDAPSPYAIANSPQPGYEVVAVVPLTDATWQATRQLYVLKRRTP